MANRLETMSRALKIAKSRLTEEEINLLLAQKYRAAGAKRAMSKPEA